jgi:hypothetical protein
MSSFTKERDKAFTDAVVNDNWDGVKAYANKYKIPISCDTVMKVGIYKAAQHCTDIPEDVKTLAMQKCLEMGFNPFIRPIAEGSESHDEN